MKEELIDPQKFQFYYRLSKYDCYRRLSGRCSLEEVFDKDTIERGLFRIQDKAYCQSLYLSLVEYGVALSIYIHSKSCGHFVITDGQHRICIAKRMNLHIPVFIGRDEDSMCPDCYKKRHSIKYRIMSWLGRNATFVDG